MAESTLTIGYPEFRRRVARYLGFNTDTSGWSSNQTTLVDDILMAGYSKFLRAKDGYLWSFLNVTYSKTLTADDYDVDMPDDFGALEGKITYSDDAGLEVRLVSEAEIRRQRQHDGTSSARSEIAAIRPKVLPTDGSSGQRYEMLLHPPPDSTYTILFPYRRIPDKLTAADPYAYGGEAHSQTIMAACLAAAELEMDGQMGVMNTEFMVQLDISMRQDARISVPDTYGRNLDRSDSRDSSHGTRYSVYVNGTLYTG